MPSFRNGDVEIAYLDEGEGEPIVLVHGFASTKEVNWVQPGWVSTLNRAGRRTVALDNRGHGASSKLYDPSAYHSTIMADDVRALLDHLKIERADIMGYSMGARITAFLAVKHAERVRSAILGGLGIRLVEGVGLPESIAEALEAASLDDIAGSRRPGVSRICRADKVRPACACCMYSRIAADFDSRGSCAQFARPSWLPSGQKIRLPGRRRPWLRLFPAHGRSTSRTATICSPSGTRSLRPALSTSLTNAHEPCAGRFAALSLPL